MDMFFEWYRKLWKWAATRSNIAERAGGFLLFALAVVCFIFVIIVIGAVQALGAIFG